jgi:hypothetical protein
MLHTVSRSGFKLCTGLPVARPAVRTLKLDREIVYGLTNATECPSMIASRFKAAAGAPKRNLCNSSSSRRKSSRSCVLVRSVGGQMSCWLADLVRDQIGLGPEEASGNVGYSGRRRASGLPVCSMPATRCGQQCGSMALPGHVA